MATHSKTLAVLATSIFLLPSALKADTGDFIIGLGIGAIGKTIIDHAASQQDPNYDTTQPPQSLPPQVPTEPTVRLSAVQIKDIQYRLNLLGYNTGRPDGVAGKQTRRAIRNFQRSLGAPATGVLTQVQLVALYERTIRKNNTASQIGQAHPTPNQQPLPQSNPSGYTEAPKTTARLPKENKLVLDPKNPPNVYGLITGKREKNIKGLLALEGYDDCVITTGLTICEKASQALKETVSVISSQNIVYGITRNVTFIDGAPRAAVMAKLSKAYPNLTRFENMATSSSKTCLEKYTGHANDLLSTAEASPSDPETLIKLSESCPNFYGIEVEGSNALSTLTIVLYDGYPLQLQIENQKGIFRTKSEAAEELKF